MEEQMRFEIDQESAEPVELVSWLVHHPQSVTRSEQISPVEIERLFQRLLRRFKRKLQECWQHHPPIEYFADGCSVPKDHPDVDEIIIYPQLDTNCQSTLELPHITDTNTRPSASSESLTMSRSDDKDQALPEYGSLPAFHFEDNNPPTTRISWHNLTIDHAELDYTSTTSNPVSGYNPQAIVFPPQTMNVAIAEHYGHLLHVFHDALPSVWFNPFADDGPIVDQSPLEGYSYPENANTGQPIFMNLFDNSSNILSDVIFRMAPNEHIHSSPKQLYMAIPTEHAYTQIDAVAHQSYTNNQSMYSQYDTVSCTNTDDSSSRSSSRTFVNDSEPVALRIFYWVDWFNKLRKI